MAEATIADFVARFIPKGSGDVEPVAGRVVLSDQRLVLAAGQQRMTIPLADVFDVRVGQVPPDLSEYFDDTIMIAHRTDDGSRTTILEADGEKIGRFRTVLFKALLGGSRVRIKHPAKVGGRVTDTGVRKASLKLEERAVTFDGLDPPLRIELASVIHFEQQERQIDGRSRPALTVRFIDDSEAITSEVVMSSPRRMNLLSRYLRLEYSGMLEEVQAVDISEAETELLVAIYSGAGDDLASVLGKEPSAVTMLLNGLEEKQLISSTDDGTKLTSLGRLAVGDRVEAVNT